MRWSGLFCGLPAVLFQQIEKRLIGKVLKFLLPIARQQFEGMPCLIIEMYVLAGQLNLPRAIVTTSPFDCQRIPRGPTDGHRPWALPIPPMSVRHSLDHLVGGGQQRFGDSEA